MSHRRQRLMKGLTAASLIGPAAGLGMMLFTACTYSTQASNTPTTDPRTGWVRVWGEDQNGLDELRTLKRCDGATLVYVTKEGYSGGVAAVPNSPECR